MKRLVSIATIPAILGLIGCTNMTPQQQGTVTGTAIGAAAGAGIAAIAGGSGYHCSVKNGLGSYVYVTTTVMCCPAGGR